MHCCATSLLTGQFWLYLRILKRRPSVIAKPSAMTKKPDQAFAFMTSPRNRCPRVIATGGINKVKKKIGRPRQAPAKATSPMLSHPCKSDRLILPLSSYFCVHTFLPNQIGVYPARRFSLRHKKNVPPSTRILRQSQKLCTTLRHAQV